MGTFSPASKYFILIFFGGCFFFLFSMPSSSSSFEGPSNEKSSKCLELECDSFCFNLNFAKCASDVFLLVDNDALKCLQQIACRASSKCSFNVIHLKNEGEKLAVMEGKTYQHLTFSNEFRFIFFFHCLMFV